MSSHVERVIPILRIFLEESKPADFMSAEPANGD